MENTHLEDELLDEAHAGAFLHEMMADRSPDQWTAWLRNNRNQARRAAYRIPHEKAGRTVLYLRSELEKFANAERARKSGVVKLSSRAAELMRAYGIGEGGTSQGRVWKGADATVQFDATQSVFVQMMINEPLTVFRMTPEQSIEVGRMLSEVGAAAKRIADSSNKPSKVEHYLPGAVRVRE